MKINLIRVSASVFIFLSLFSAASFADDSVPTSPSIVTVQTNDRRLFIQDRLPSGTLGSKRAYVMHGVNWSPTSPDTDPGANPAVFQSEFLKWYQSDIQKMKQMGVNTVRIYHDFGTSPADKANGMKILDEFYKNGIKVIMQVDSPRHGVIADYNNSVAVVNAYKNHPAILMWAIGNEWDLNLYGLFYFTFQTIQEAAQFVNNTAHDLKQIDSQHPVSTLTINPHDPVLHPLSQAQFPFLHPSTGVTMDMIVNQLVPNIDVWGLNVYQKDSLRDLFQMWRSISNKPIYLGEFGLDAYDHRINSPDGAENQEMQKQGNSYMWDEIFLELSAQRFNGSVIGGLVFEWNDEWWKKNNSSPLVHDISYGGNYGQLDGYNDEEWFGILDINRNPRSAYSALQTRFLNDQIPSTIGLNPNPVIRAISQGNGSLQYTSEATFQIGDKTVFSRAGGEFGARGINVAILDVNNGIRMKEVRSFDTWRTANDQWGGSHIYFVDLINYLNSLPNGTIILFSIADEGGFIAGPENQNPNHNLWNDFYVQQGFDLLVSATYGSTQLRNVDYQGAWVMITKKGVGKLAESFSNGGVAVAEAQISLNLNPNFDKRLLADANGDGIVDAADYVLWRKNLGWQINTNPADFDNNHYVNQADYSIWRSHFGGAGAGDANGDGTVNGADYIIWRRQLGWRADMNPADFDGNGQVNQADYMIWRSELGKTSADNIAGSGAGAEQIASVESVAPVPQNVILIPAVQPVQKSPTVQIAQPVSPVNQELLNQNSVSETEFIDSRKSLFDSQPITLVSFQEKESPLNFSSKKENNSEKNENSSKLTDRNKKLLSYVLVHFYK